MPDGWRAVSSPSHSMDEIEVILTIKDGKSTVESRSGPKSGSVRLDVEEGKADLVMTGAGNDTGKATLTGPELSHFRTIVDAGLSSMDLDQSALEQDRRVLFSGYQSLTRVDDAYVATLDGDALQRLGLVEPGGDLAGGGRQIRCTVLNSGTAMLNLLDEDETRAIF